MQLGRADCPAARQAFDDAGGRAPCSEELAKVALIRFYLVGGREYLEVTGWFKHQKVDRPQKSDFRPRRRPACPRRATCSRRGHGEPAAAPDAAAGSPEDPSPRDGYDESVE